MNSAYGTGWYQNNLLYVTALQRPAPVICYCIANYCEQETNALLSQATWGHGGHVVVVATMPRSMENYIHMLSIWAI